MDPTRPTEAELEILGVLWRRGRCSVREVYTELAPHRGTGYTTTLKLMQLMLAKGLVTRDERAISHLYTAKLKPAPAQKRILRDLIAGLFTGSTTALMQQALQVGEFKPGELAELRALIDAHAQKQDQQSARKDQP